MDLTTLEKAYWRRQPYHGELHDHAATGGTSDGLRSLSHWKLAMRAWKMDFAAILDHRQVRHMFLPEWEDTSFICGTEPGTHILDVSPQCKVSDIHYNMLFPTPEPLMELLSEFAEYEYTGGTEGHFVYPSFTRERMGQLIDAVKAKGGLWVHPHPKQVMDSSEPMDYFFRDDTGLEVFYNRYDTRVTKDNYALWLELLALGKRIWACAGGDFHCCATNQALTTVYAEDNTCPSLLSHIRTGDFVCGSVGIRMCIGDTRMGGIADFEDATLLAVVDDFHDTAHLTYHNFRFDLWDDTGVQASASFSCEKPFTFQFRVNSDAKFYRIEIIDETQGLPIALGNPIWNQKYCR